MSCSYEEYLEHLSPTKFYGAGILKRWRLVYVVAAVALVPLFGSSSPAVVLAGDVAAVLVALAAFWELRHSSLRYWSQKAERPLMSLSERNVYVEELRVEVLLARLDPDPELAVRQLVIELESAEKELHERRTKKEVFPRWYGAVLLALLATGLKLIPQSTKGIEVLAVIAILASAGVALKLILDALLEVPTTNFAGYARLLRRAKRRLDLEALRRKATIRPAA